MAKQEDNMNLPDNKPSREESVFVDMGIDQREFERLAHIIYDGRNSYGLRLTGTLDLMESEFVQILLDPVRRQDLLRRYKIILDNFRPETREFPQVYVPVVNTEGKIVDATKTPIGEFFGGWARRDNITTRYENNTGMKAVAMQGGIRFPINIIGDRYTRFLADIRTLYQIVTFIDVELKKPEYQIKSLEDIRIMPGKQMECIRMNLGMLLESGSPLAKSLPYKEVEGRKIFIESDFMKGDIIKFLSKPNTAFLNEALSAGNFNDRFLTVEVLKHIINGVIGEENYIMLMSEPLAGEVEKVGKKQEDYQRFFVRCIYMDVLGNIGYAQVEASAQYGNTIEQQQRAVQGLVARQALIMAFPAFKSLKCDPKTQAPKGTMCDYLLFKEQWRKKKDQVFKSGNYTITCDSKMQFRIEPKKDSDIKVDEYNLGLVTDTLRIYEEKLPKRPLLLEKQESKKKEAKLVEVPTEEREISQPPEIVNMEEEKKMEEDSKEEEKKEE